jgi:hypothetical protein
MGIVVAVFMLVGLLMASPWLPPGTRRLRSSPNMVDWLASGMLLAGLWNALWYGLRHLAEFWGVAALVSGAVMVAVAVLLLLEHSGDAWRRQPVMVRAHALFKPLAVPLVIALGLCFGLYAFALERLNLGLSIPG